MKSLVKRVMRSLGYEIIQVRKARYLPPNEMGFFPFDSINSARFMYYHDLFAKVGDIPGDVVECGVGHGRSLIMLAHLVRLLNSDKNLWGFDSFEGFPEPRSGFKNHNHLIAIMAQAKLKKPT